MVNSRSGRPPGAPHARTLLLRAARAHLDRGDLGSISSRPLAADAGVSHSLVNYHFGSKDVLIAAALGASVAPHDVMAFARDGATGKIETGRLVHGLLALWEDPETGRMLLGFARELSAQGSAAGAITSYLQNVVFSPLASDFGIARARRMAIAIVGFLFGRYVLRLPTLASLTVVEAGETLRLMLD